MDLKDKKIVIIGGSSGIGYAVAELLLKERATIVLVGRSKERLASAAERLNYPVETYQADLMDEGSLEQLFKKVGSFDHLQLPGSDLVSGSFSDLPIETARKSFDSKFWGPYNAVRLAMRYLNPQGSVTLYSGAYSQKPAKNGAAITAAINGAIESFTKAIAQEIAPIRVNVVSPGLTLTERFTNRYDEEELGRIVNQFCQQTIIQRAANPQEVAKAAIYFMGNDYATGNRLFVDGGLTLS